MSYEKLESAYLVTYTKQSGKKGKSILKVKIKQKVPMKHQENKAPCFFYWKKKGTGNIKKDYLNYKKQFAKKDKLISYVCYESFYIDILNNIWWIDYVLRVWWPEF